MNWIKHNNQTINLDHVKVITYVVDFITLLFVDDSYIDLIFEDDNEALDFYSMLQNRLLS